MKVRISRRKKSARQRTYAYYESGQRMIPPRVLCALADFYGVSVDYLIGRTGHKETYGDELKFFCLKASALLPSCYNNLTA